MAIMSNVQFDESMTGVSIEIEATDLNKNSPDTPTGFRWLQTVITSDPLDGKGTEYVDQGKASTPFPDPFYNRTPVTQKEPGKFEDFPRRFVPPAGKVVSWDATLTLVAFDLRSKWLQAHDIRTYGFDLKLMKGTDTVGEVVLRRPKADWAAFQKHIQIVQLAYADWKFSLLKFRN